MQHSNDIEFQHYLEEDIIDIRFKNILKRKGIKLKRLTFQIITTLLKVFDYHSF